MKKLLAILLSAFLLFSLAACGDKGNSPTGGGKEPPTREQWADAGINGTFTAEVKGELALSVVDNGEISMKWTGSDEASLDNTITWLKQQGFSSYGGRSAQKTTDEGGKLVTYIAEKTIGGANPLSAGADNGYSATPLSVTFTATSGESKTMIAEAFYVTEDFSIMGTNLKAGELYLDIYEAPQIGGGSSLLTAWPASQIQASIGESIPAYTGAASGYQFIDGSIGSIKSAQVNVFGAGEEDATAYNALLEQNGYLLNDDEVYEKTLANGDSIQITAFASMSYRPDTFEIADTVSIMVMLEKNSGAYSSWNQLNLSVFNGSGIPAYSGGTSFELDDIGAQTIKAEKEAIEQAISTMAAFESLLDDEQKAELAALRAQLPYFDYIECYIITVYGTSSEQADAYEAALASAGFSGGVKQTADYEFEVDVDDDDGKVIITVTRIPIQLLESSGSAGAAPTESDLPTNIKIVYSNGIYNSTAIKIGDDYVLEREMAGFFEYVYYKKNGASWDIYRKEMFETEWQLDDYCETERKWVENEVFDFIIDGVEGSKTGTDTLLGKTVDVYVDDFSSSGYTYTYTYYTDTATGLVLKVVAVTPMGTTTYAVNDLDTAVTSFGDIELPQ